MRCILLGPVLAGLTMLAAAGCAGTSSGDAAPAAGTAAPTASATTEPSTPATTSPTSSPAPPPDDAQPVALTVAGGQVTGDTGRVEVPLGTTVRVMVTADIVDEIHVHGFDLQQGTVVGQPTSLEFVADQAGVYEIELEESRTLLTRLQVQ